METRANHLLIGGFVLATVVAFFGFVIWMAKIEIDREFDRYSIYFEGSVSGLSVAGEVRYKGIPVGTVQEIGIDPRNPNRVRVTIEVAGNTPIKEDTVAQLELQGITGVSYVQLTGGSPESPSIEVSAGERLPVIASRPSQFEELFAGAPELINRFILLLSEATKVFDAQNRVAISDTLANLQLLTTTLAQRSGDIDGILTNVAKTSDEMRLAAENVNSTMERLVVDLERVVDGADSTMSVVRGAVSNADAIMDSDVRLLIADLRKVTQSYARVGDQLDRAMAENQETVTDFLGEGLYEFTRLVTEMRLMVGNLTRLADRLESDPAQFLFGDSSQGFEAQ
jgi:phospholipid/cholesterol/gamma-HCH transport system substrate-binding protein